MYFFATYKNGAYEVSEVGFATAEQARYAAEQMRLEFGFVWILVHFPRYQHAAAA